jgi:predicted RNA-binding Zn ribbon-like protein
MAYERRAAPGALGRVEAFGNSARLLYGEDAWADLAGARAWLGGHGWERAARAAGEADRAALVAVREALRAHLAGTAAADDRAVLDGWAGRVLAPPRWSAEGRPVLPVAAASPVEEVVGEVLAALLAEELAGGRARLKACRLPECRWLFYDRSPAANSVWCSMEICGARHKMRSYRTRRAAPTRGT